jgi:hypothetical protein
MGGAFQPSAFRALSILKVISQIHRRALASETAALELFAAGH